MPKGNPNPNPATRFKPGNNANPGGKPVASRNALSAAFLKELSADFTKNGKSAIKEMRENHPDRYIAVIASLVPKENDVNVTIKRDAREYTDDELAAIIADEIGSRARDDAAATGEGESTSLH